MPEHTHVPPWKIKVIEPIALVPPQRRLAALDEAGWNTFGLRSEDVFIDLLTDSGTSALSQEQRAAMELGDEAYAGSRSFYRLEAAMRETYGYTHLIPAHQGRGAEHLLSKIAVRPGQLVASNLYFTTSRAHAELAGGIWHDVSIPEAVDPESDASRSRATWTARRWRRCCARATSPSSASRPASTWPAASRSRSRTCGRCAR